MPTPAYEGPYFSILLDARGEEYVYTRDEVLVVPLLDEGTVILAIEPSSAFGEPVLLLPGGTAEPDESLVETANRELREEAGYKAGTLDFLGELRPFSKYMAVRSFIYLARDLVASPLVGDETFEIGNELVPLAGFEQLIAAQRLFDARAIAALYMARHFLR